MMRALSGSLQPIMLLGFHIWDFFQCPLEVLPVEESRSGLDVLAAGKAIGQGGGDELLDRHLVLGRKLSSLVIQLFRYSNDLAHIRCKTAKEAPRRDRRAETMTLVSKTILYIWMASLGLHDRYVDAQFEELADSILTKCRMLVAKLR